MSTTVTETGPAPRIPLAQFQAELIDNAAHYGLGFEITDTDDGPEYVVRRSDGELLVRTLDIEEADRAIADAELPIGVKIVAEADMHTSSPFEVRPCGGGEVWYGADEIVTVPGDEGRPVMFVALADREEDPARPMTELWIREKGRHEIKLGSTPDRWHKALDAMTKVVAALDAAYAESRAID